MQYDLFFLVWNVWLNRLIQVNEKEQASFLENQHGGNARLYKKKKCPRYKKEEPALCCTAASGFCSS